MPVARSVASEEIRPQGDKAAGYMKQLERALINADAAGDIEAAKTLAGEILKVRSASTQKSIGSAASATSDKPAAGPWETYAAQPAASGPWTKYQTPAVVETAEAPNTSPSASKGGVAGGVFMGAVRDPVDAGAQLLPRALSAVTSLGGMAPNKVSQFFDSEAGRVDSMVKNANAEYQQSREMAGRGGVDAARLVGNVVSPATVAVATRVPIIATNGMRTVAARGAIQGGLGGAMQPVTDTENFARDKAIQTVGGAVGGALLTPAAFKAGEAIARGGQSVMNALRPPQMTAAQSQQIDNMVTEALRRDGIEDLSEIPANMLNAMREQAAQALRTGQRSDPAAAVRQQEFQALGMQPTTGQLTRDPTQYARERDMRGVAGAGEMMAKRFFEQNTQLAGRLNALGAVRAQDADVAGNRLISALQAADSPREQAVSAAYQAARDSSGRYANVDVQAFSHKANSMLDEQMLGRFLPNEVRSLMNDISDGTVPLNVNNLVQADSVMSAAQRAAQARGDKAGAKAIGAVRSALNDAPIESGLPATRGAVVPYGHKFDPNAVGAEVDPNAAAKAAFDTARGMARERFQTIENTPGLKAALEGADPEKFVKKYILNGTTNELNALTRVLDPEAQQVARAQIAGYLRDKAFGANAAGDKGFAQESYNRALKEMGENKLRTLFTPEEVTELQRVGRVGAYISSQPAGSAVNNSNTGAAVMNLLSSMSGKLGSYPGLNLVRDSVRNYKAERFAHNALAGQVPKQAAELPPEVMKRLLAPLSAIPIGAASAMGSPSQ